jgi:hypothetical protein
MNKTDDLDIIDRFKAGDASVFEEIVLKHQDRIYSAGICSGMKIKQ